MDDQALSTGKLSIPPRFFRRLAGWAGIRRALLTLACFGTLIAVFYTEENWRGKRAWEKCKRELEAKGVVLDWNAYVPPPVADDQNFFKAPGINESDWVGRGSHELSKRLGSVWQGDTNPMTVAELTVVPSRAGPKVQDPATVLRLDDSSARAQAEQSIRATLGPSTQGTHDRYPLTAWPLNQIKPAVVMVQSDNLPDAKKLLEIFPATLQGSRLRIKPAGTNSFLILLSPPPVAAGDYLRRSDLFEADFDNLREALKRPYTRMAGDYAQPATVPIPNFITMRMVAQVLAERVKCYLLLGQPEQALRELTLLQDICRVLEARPTGKPMTLVAAMINVAITGLYANTVADGMRLQAWREPQLEAIQEQLARINLAPFVAEAFRGERVFGTYTIEHTSRAELAKLFLGDETKSLWQRFKDTRYTLLTVAPRGWFYQNMIVHAKMLGLAIEAYDPMNNVFLPATARIASRQISAFRISPYNFFLAMSLPNFTRAWQTTARNQTQANLALIACALERYHLAQAAYPETLDALLPRFIEKIPHDLIGGARLKYWRVEGGTYLLYSIGWNEKDDGGQSALNKVGGEDLDNGDWVWQTN